MPETTIQEPPASTTEALTPDFLADAKALLGDKGWRMDSESLEEAATPWRGTYQGHTPFLALPVW